MAHARLFSTFATALMLAVAAAPSPADESFSHDLSGLPVGSTLHKVTATAVEYRGRKATKVEFTEEATRVELGVSVDNPTFVMLPARFKNGTIEVDVLGRLSANAPRESRAFVGLVYRVVAPDAGFEAVYLRPTNGRKKNPPAPRDRRAIQYFAYPDWKFPRLRSEYPDGRYEAGANIADDEWIRLKIEIDDLRVRVSVNGKEELALTEAKAVPTTGNIGLWVGIGAQGYFANLRVTPR
jgi:hypothetical protein